MQLHHYIIAAIMLVMVAIILAAIADMVKRNRTACRPPVQICSSCGRYTDWTGRNVVMPELPVVMEPRTICNQCKTTHQKPPTSGHTKFTMRNG